MRLSIVGANHPSVLVILILPGFFVVELAHNDEPTMKYFYVYVLR